MEKNRNNKNIVKAAKTGIVTCLICLAVLFVFTINKKVYTGNTSPLDIEEEINLGASVSNDIGGGGNGDTCEKTWKIMSGWSNWACKSGGSTTSAPTSSTEGETYTQYSNVNDSTGTGCRYASSGSLTNCSACTKSRNWRAYTECTRCGSGKYLEDGSCEFCLNNYYAPAGSEGESSCYIVATRGHYVSRPGGSPIECPKDTYSNVSSKVTYGHTSSCKSCPSGTETSGTGSTSEYDCHEKDECDCANAGGWLSQIACKNKCQSGFDKALDWVKEHSTCANATSYAQLELSPGSTFGITVSTQAEGCSYNYSVSYRGTTSTGVITPSKFDRTYNVGIADIDLSLVPCTLVTWSVSGNGFSKSGKAQVKTNWSSYTSKKTVGSDEVIPEDKQSADLNGTSYYGDNDDCEIVDGKKVCNVITRSDCGSTPQESCYYNEKEKKYCWGPSDGACGSGYNYKPDVAQSNCENVCYCNADGSSCGIWAKKGWAGYEELKYPNGANIKVEADCKRPKACYCEIDGGGCSIRVVGNYNGYTEIKKNGQTITNASECKKPESCFYNSTTKKYCWNTHAGACGTGFTSAGSVSKDNCVNVCYCDASGKDCGVWAKKGWANHEEVKDASGKNITDPNKCVWYNYCCVNNGYLELSTSVQYKKKQLTKACPTNYTLVDGLTEAECKVPEQPPLGACQSEPITNSDPDKTASTCESTVPMKISDGQKCTNTTTSSEEKSFYKITCVKNNDVTFDYGNDNNKNTTRKLYNGEGIAYAINISEKYNCTYTFFNTVWDNTYNAVLNRIGAIDGTLKNYAKSDNYKEFEKYINNVLMAKRGVKDASRLYELYRILNDDLVNVVNDYNGYKLDITYPNLVATATIKTKENTKIISTDYSFQRKLTNAGTGVKSGAKTNTLANGEKVESYIINNESKPRTETLLPKRVCFDKTTGKIGYANNNGNCPSNTIDGGNKMYIGHDTDKTEENVTYSMSVVITGLGPNKITNDKCNIGVLKTTYIYRPIDVNNPFINSEWKKGDNWTNNLYDFTNVIHSTTWLEELYKKISLQSSDISEVQKSNTTNQALSPYLGLCDRIESSVQDAATKKICEAIK